VDCEGNLEPPSLCQGAGLERVIEVSID
jgi:hypothetical protein